MTAHLEHSVRLRHPADLVAVVPYLLGFHPERSLVAMVFEPHAEPGTATESLRFSLRVDLPKDSAETPELVRRLTQLLTRNGAERVAVIGYGPGWHVTPVMDAVRGALASAGILMLDAVRVEDGRYWSYLCMDTDCCPRDGAPYDMTTNPAAAAAVFAGLVAHPDRTAFAAAIASVDGQDREQVHAATLQACAETRRLLATRDDGSWWYHDGLRQVEAALAHAQAGGNLSAEAVALLGIRLTAILVRDGEFAAAPAALLALAALYTGDGALARVAVDRALSVNPDYNLARLIHTALHCGLSPEQARAMDVPSMADDIATQAAQHPDGARPMLPEGW